MEFEEFFRIGSNGNEPYPYQLKFAKNSWPETLIIPTGFGKTETVISSWLWKVSTADANTPRRLVYCLPMRTLVEQTSETAQEWISNAQENLNLDCEFDQLMGGQDSKSGKISKWISNPELPAILVGTQDMLISAALMRGYGITRYRWPVNFALLNNDALWVFDEVQLSGATITTSAQLEAFRKKFGTSKPCRTVWMSATLDPNWLNTADYTPTDNDRPHDLTDSDLKKVGKLWNAKKKLSQLELKSHSLSTMDGQAAYAKEVASRAIEVSEHNQNTIIFMNTVKRARNCFNELQKLNSEMEVCLIHSRFRTDDRMKILKRISDDPSGNGRIIVTTQALEAGVDISSKCMISELAPWSSFVQRIGRCNRRGEFNEAQVYWIDIEDEFSIPYVEEEFSNSRSILRSLTECGPSMVSELPLSEPKQGAVIRSRDLIDLFDTDPDLSGFDMDVSPFIRDAIDTDVRFFWRPLPAEANRPAPESPTPLKEELCSVGISEAKMFVKKKNTNAWIWDALRKNWIEISETDLYPGLVVWIDSKSGGYNTESGFDPTLGGSVESNVDLSTIATKPEGFEDDRDSNNESSTIPLTDHSMSVRSEASNLTKSLGFESEKQEIVDAIVEASHWHDYGKSHFAFVQLYSDSEVQNFSGEYLAKWPRKDSQVKSERRYFRHELASALAYLENKGWSSDANLTAYLIAAHHGKIRMRIRALPTEKSPKEENKLFARGVVDGDDLPAVDLGGGLQILKTALKLEIMQLGDSKECGQSWSTRVNQLLDEYGPFKLAWYEIMVRLADWRVSSNEEEIGKNDL